MSNRGLCTLSSWSLSALTLLVGRQEGHPARKKTWALGWWRGYLSGARCRLAYGPADATATHCLLPNLNPDSFYLSGIRLTQVVLERRPLNGSSSRKHSIAPAVVKVIAVCLLLNVSVIAINHYVRIPSCYRLPSGLRCDNVQAWSLP